MNYRLVPIIIGFCAVLMLNGCGGGGESVGGLLSPEPTQISAAGGTVNVAGLPRLDFPPGIVTSPTVVTVTMQSGGSDSLTQDVVADVSGLLASTTTSSTITVFFYPESVSSLIAPASARREVPQAEVTTLKFSGSTKSFNLSELAVSAAIFRGTDTVSLTASSLEYDPVNRVVRAKFFSATPIIGLANAASNASSTPLIMKARLSILNLDTTVNLHRLSNQGEKTNQIVSSLVTDTGVRIPLILVHGIQIGLAACGETDAYEGTWKKFLERYFSAEESELRNKYEIFSLAYPTNVSFKDNGIKFAQVLSNVFGTQSVVVMAHSMGGLVTRAADAYGSPTAKISRVITLDTPHHGTPLINDIAEIREAACFGAASTDGAKSLAWDERDAGRSCSASGNPDLCDLNTNHLGALRKYVPYSAYSSAATAGTVFGANLRDDWAAYLLSINRPDALATRLLVNLSDSVVAAYVTGDDAKLSDIAVLLPSQRLQDFDGARWKDVADRFLDLPDTYDATWHVPIGPIPGITSSDRAWSQKADGSAGGVRGHLLAFIKPDLLPKTVALNTSIVTQGGQITVNWSMGNVGLGNALASSTGLRLLPALTSGFGSSANNLLNVPTAALASGGVANQSQAITIPSGTAPGSYVIVVVADNTSPSVLGQSNVTNDSLRSEPFTVVAAPAALELRFEDEFSGTTLDSAKWTLTAGSATVGGNGVTLGCFGNINTQNKVAFSGSKIVVESAFYGVGRSGSRGVLYDSAIQLVDSATGSRIHFGDTNYQGSLLRAYGMYFAGSNLFNIVQTSIAGTTQARKEFRLTIEQNLAKLERGDSLATLTESSTFTLPNSISGRSFYLLVGSGGPDHCNSYFDWVRVLTN